MAFRVSPRRVLTSLVSSAAVTAILISVLSTHKYDTTSGSAPRPLLNDRSAHRSRQSPREPEPPNDHHPQVDSTNHRTMTPNSVNQNSTESQRPMQQQAALLRSNLKHSNDAPATQLPVALRDNATMKKVSIIHATTMPLPPKLRPITDEKTMENNVLDAIRTYADTQPKLPKILHQIYRDSNVPDMLVSSIQSWMKHHPDMKYYFWDDTTAKSFIERYYPDFLPIYNGYCHDLFRSDALRYFILYHFGGIYADMDYDCFKPLFNNLTVSHCHLVQENQPQARLIWNVDDMVQNALMASSPQHPFMKYLILSLKPSPTKFPKKKRCIDYVLDTTGPWFLYRRLSRYRELVKSANINTSECDVNILPYQHYMPGYDMNKGKPSYYFKCRKAKKLNNEMKAACEWFKPKRNKPPDFSINALANHRFLHLGYQAKPIRKVTQKFVNISDIVPAVSPLGGKL